MGKCGKQRDSKTGESFTGNDFGKKKRKKNMDFETGSKETQRVRRVKERQHIPYHGRGRKIYDQKYV